jgi:tRNA(Ile)-lysidine synthase
MARAPVADDDSATHGGPVACDPMVAHFDEDTFGLPLTVRPWRAGDVFCPSGMGGKKKKLQDYFVDTKVPKGVRSQIPLIVAPEGILWIPGYRQDDRFRCRSTTQHTCSVQIVR